MVASPPLAQTGSGKQRPLETRTGKLWLDDAGIMRFEYSPGSVTTRAEAEENVAAFNRLSEGKKFPFLCNVTRCKSVDREARALFGRREVRERYTAMAIVSDAPIGNMIANFYFSLYGRDNVTPTRVFTSDASAVAWLKGFLKE